MEEELETTEDFGSEVKAALMSLHHKHGGLTPRIIVDAAADKSSPLHPVIYDRSDSEAADSFRLIRAGQVIRSIKIVYRKDNTEEVRKVNAFTSIRSEKKTAYHPTTEVVADEKLLAIALADMERQWRDLHRRWQHISEFSELVLRTINESAV